MVWIPPMDEEMCDRAVAKERREREEEQKALEEWRARFAKTVARAILGDKGEEEKTALELVIDAMCERGLVRRVEVTEEEARVLADAMCSACDCCAVHAACNTLGDTARAAVSALGLRLVSGDGGDVCCI